MDASALKAELLRLLAEDADFRAAVREAMQMPSDRESAHHRRARPRVPRPRVARR